METEWTMKKYPNGLTEGISPEIPGVTIQMWETAGDWTMSLEGGMICVSRFPTLEGVQAAAAGLQDARSSSSSSTRRRKQGRPTSG